MDKFTKRDILTALLEMTKTGELTIPMEVVADYATKTIAAMDKRQEKDAEKRKTATADLREAVYEVLGSSFMTGAEILEALNDEELTVAKITYQLNALVKEGLVDKGDVKIPATEDTKARVVKGYCRVTKEPTV